MTTRAVRIDALAAEIRDLEAEFHAAGSGPQRNRLYYVAERLLDRLDAEAETAVQRATERVLGSVP